MEKATIFAAAQPEFDTFPRLIDALGLQIEKDITVPRCRRMRRRE